MDRKRIIDHILTEIGRLIGLPEGWFVSVGYHNDNEDYSWGLINVREDGISSFPKGLDDCPGLVELVDRWYEEHGPGKGCEFCSGGKSVPLDHRLIMRQASFSIVGDCMVFDNGRRAKIKYCPICGRRLKEGEYDYRAAQMLLKETEDKLEERQMMLRSCVAVAWCNVTTYRDFDNENERKEFIETFSRADIDERAALEFNVVMPPAKIDESNRGRGVNLDTAEAYDEEKLLDTVHYTYWDIHGYMRFTTDRMVIDPDRLEKLAVEHVLLAKTYDRPGLHTITEDDIRRYREFREGLVEEVAQLEADKARYEEEIKKYETRNENTETEC